MSLAVAPIKRRRWRPGLTWALSAALLIGYALLRSEGDEPRTVDEADDPVAQLPDEDRGKELLEVIEVRPGETTPGSAVEISFINTYADHSRPLRAWLSVTDYRAGKQLPSTELKVLLNSEGRLVARIPPAAFEGRAKVRVGYDKDARSKPYDLRIRNVSYRKLFREVLGGLALLFFGLRVMARGSRQYTGDRGQGLIGHIGRRSSAALGLGVAVGGITQFTTTAAGLVVGLVESHLLAVAPAVLVLLGAQLGAAVTPSVLGLVSTREGLLVLSIGVLWLTLATDRRSEAFGKIILGCGLLFFGLYLLRQGFEPLVSNPELLPYIDHFDASKPAGRLFCVAAGVLLAAVLQGPAPVFVLVLGLAQSTGRLDLSSALAILAGTALGSAIGTQVVAGPFGPAARRVARLHLLLGLTGTALLAAGAGLLAGLADALVPGNVAELAYGKKILMPNMGRHLVAGFALGQVLVTTGLALALPVVLRMTEKSALPARRRGPAPKGETGADDLRAGLVSVLSRHREALAAAQDLCLQGHRGRGRDCEHLLADSRVQIETLWNEVLSSNVAEPGKPPALAGAADAELYKLRQAALATVQLQRSFEELLRHAERATEQSLAISPAGEGWQMSPQDAATLKTLHALITEGLEALIEELRAGVTPDLDAARSREIRLNATEAESRQALLVDAEKGEPSRLIALRLNRSELVNAYETVGNHLYRLNEALASEVDQESQAI
jgi:Na+/phosphate symporter